MYFIDRKYRNYTVVSDSVSKTELYFNLVRNSTEPKQHVSLLAVLSSLTAQMVLLETATTVFNSIQLHSV